MGDGNTAFTGKKIFFVHPSAFTQNEIIFELAQQEYEVYTVKDEEKLKRILKKYPDSFVFASIDETISSAKWEAWIRSVIGNEASKEIKIGVLSNTNNEESRKLYLNTLNVECGFIPVKQDKSKVLKILSDILNAGEARGRRKYIRADTRGETMTTINVPSNGTYITGEIRDISVVGLSCAFAQDPELGKNSLLHDIQIKLQSTLLKAEGIVFGSRMDETDKVYVLVFSQRIDPAVKTKIRTYIQKNLQSKMDVELK
ncbi:MAG: PilZ domain-containing protein [Treponema sp.]|nr:PilZ domain-containing protein [Treponema sp.]